MNEITLYIEVLIFSVFCVLNHSMSVNRKRANFQKMYDDLMGKDKAKADKKND